MCGLKRAVVSGGDVGPLGANASHELGRLMRWAGAGAGLGTGRGAGVGLILDGAEAVLGDRRHVRHLAKFIREKGRERGRERDIMECGTDWICFSVL